MDEPSDTLIEGVEEHFTDYDPREWDDPRLVEVDSFRHDAISIHGGTMVYEPEHEGYCYWTPEGVQSVPVIRNGLMVTESEYDDVVAKVLVMDLDTVVVAKSDLAEFGEWK